MNHDPANRYPANPYNWQSHSPSVQILREGVERAAELMLHNGSAVVLGGRGMGKSVFLHQTAEHLRREPGTEVIVIEAPPASLAVEACLGLLAAELGVEVDLSARRIFDKYFARLDAPERLVLLFDEFDRYAEKGEPSAQPPGRGFFNDLEAARRSLPRLSLLAAGSLGIFVFRDVLGSSFLSRALHLRLRPFPQSEVSDLARPFERRGSPLLEETLDALYLSTGGIPALLTFGLQQLWTLEEASPRDVSAIYKMFEEEYAEYVRDLLSALTNPQLSDAPGRVWAHIRENEEPYSRSALETALGKPSGTLNLDLADTLHLLEAVGVVRIEGSALRDDPVTAQPIASLLNLPRRAASQDDLAGQFHRDLTTLLGRLHRSSVDFFRAGKELVPESVFAAHLALGFELLGWRCEREAQRAAGRTDLLLRRNGDGVVIIVEIKIWGRNDYRDAERQVAAYWADDVAFGAVVQVSDARLPDWPERYRRECLEPTGAMIEERPIDGSTLRGVFQCREKMENGLEISIGHYLVALARRKFRHAG